MSGSSRARFSGQARTQAIRKGIEVIRSDQVA
jgi:hypothetical protein